MKRLTLIRHAKSSWDDDSLPDLERPLNQRGQRDAPVMAARLADRKPDINLLLSSPALRARQTAETIAQALSVPINTIHIEPGIYAATSGSDLLNLTRDFADRHRHVALVGHNPVITELANRMVGGTVDDLPTCAVITLELDIGHWIEIRDGLATMQYFDYPKRIG